MTKELIKVWEEWICQKCDQKNLTQRQSSMQPAKHRECVACGFTETSK